MITNFLHHQTYQWGAHHIKLCIPDSRYIQRLYRDQKHSDPKTPFPYWTQVWPAALAMIEFLVKQPAYVRGKKVLEIAAGLGLPSLVVAQWAEEVYCSDYLPEAVSVIEQSVVQNALTNVKPLVLDWNHLPADLLADVDVLLLSDINYDPSQFETLYEVLQQFWRKGATIILTTPQRLMAKPFVEKILTLAEKVEEVMVKPYEERIAISLFVLRKNGQENAN